MKRVRVAVIGAGPMGQLHARTVSQSAARDGDCVLVAIVDRHVARAAQLAGVHRVAALDDLRSLRDVDAAIVAVPTAAHVDTALALAESGLDLLVEKPLARSAAEGMRLVERAEALGRILQVGHVEWYNPSWRSAVARVGSPRRICMRRMHPASERGLDVDVVQDLMLHDLDWVTRTVGGDADLLEARGSARVGHDLDEAQVRLRFRSGCIAELSASRVHATRERWLEIEGSEGSAAVDLHAPSARENEANDELDPLGLQWRAFVAAVATRTPPANDGRVGVAALAWVERVRAAIRDHDRTGAFAAKPGEPKSGEMRGHDSSLRR